MASSELAAHPAHLLQEGNMAPLHRYTGLANVYIPYLFILSEFMAIQINAHQESFEKIGCQVP